MSNRIYGADLCYLQGNIDAEAMKASGIDFCYVQCTRYSKESDDRFDGYVKQLRDAGVVVGAYHFCWQGGDPKQQAERFFLKSGGLGQNPGELPPMIDWEFCKDLPEATCVDFLVQMAREVKGLWYPHGTDRGHRMPVIYTYPDFCRRHPKLAGVLELAEYPLCHAWYGQGKAWTPAEDQMPKLVPDPWHKPTLWQYSGDHGLKVPGVGPDCDRQVYLGDDWIGFLGLDTDHVGHGAHPGHDAPIIHDMNSYFVERNR